jgi:hypothetical protein
VALPRAGAEDPGGSPVGHECRRHGPSVASRFTRCGRELHSPEGRPQSLVAWQLVADSSNVWTFLLAFAGGGLGAVMSPVLAARYGRAERVRHLQTEPYNQVIGAAGELRVTLSWFPTPEYFQPEPEAMLDRMVDV